MRTGLGRRTTRPVPQPDLVTRSWVCAIALAGGATGYLLGSISRQRLRRELDEARYRATHDALTGLFNRFAAYDALDVARRRGQQMSVAIIDVDSLKFVNDFHGHDSGDRVLRHVAAQLAGSLRTGIAARLGGDEFLLVVPGGHMTADDAARRAAKRISSVPVQLERGSWTVGVSIGVSAASRDGKDYDTLLQRADAAMYEAKHGRQDSDVDYAMTSSSIAYPNRRPARQCRTRYHRSRIRCPWESVKRRFGQPRPESPDNVGMTPTSPVGERREG